MISYLIGLGVLFIILLGVSLLAAWFGASMYKTGYRDGAASRKQRIYRITSHPKGVRIKHDD